MTPPTVADRTRRAAREDGIALVTVIGLTFALTLLVTATVSFAVRTLPQTRDHEDWNAALAAAEAGIDDLLYRLNQDRTYWSRPDPDNEAMTGWRPLPGGGSDASYSYFFDASQVGRTGAVDVTSTGRVGDQTRTVQVRLRPDGFLEAIYFTDFEASDPFALTANASNRTYLDRYCAVYHPHRDTRPVNASNARYGGCSDIRFAPGDVLVGPTRSNDAILMRPGRSGGAQGPRFLGRVETGWDGRDDRGRQTGQLWLRDDGSSGDPVFEEGLHRLPNGRLQMPETSRSIAEQARASGCAYEGPTYIHLRGTRMDVSSPLTPNPPSRCVGSNLPLADGEVLYVEASDRSVRSHPLDLPIRGDVTPYSRTAGDVFIHGTLDGQLTVAADDDVVIVSDLVYAQRDAVSSNDLLGLIADNNVLVYHPVAAVTSRGRLVGYENLASQGRNLAPFTATGSRGGFSGNGASTWQDPEIDAAILALNRSFGVQNFNLGDPFTSGELSVTGAIAQRWRGPVATSSGNGGGLASGYLKDYVYDTRLKYLTPPYFLEPERSPWQRGRWAELDAPPACTGTRTPARDACLPS